MYYLSVVRLSHNDRVLAVSRKHGFCHFYEKSNRLKILTTFKAADGNWLQRMEPGLSSHLHTLGANEHFYTLFVEGEALFILSWRQCPSGVE